MLYLYFIKDIILKGNFMKKLSEKTNVMRILDKNKINYIIHNYLNTGAISGEDVAKVLNQDPKMVFKTLVTIGHSKNYYVFLPNKRQKKTVLCFTCLLPLPHWQNILAWTAAP